MVRSRPRVPSVASSRVGEPGDRSIGLARRDHQSRRAPRQTSPFQPRGATLFGAVDLMGAHNVLMVLFEHGRGVRASPCSPTRVRRSWHASTSQHIGSSGLSLGRRLSMLLHKRRAGVLPLRGAGWRRNARPLASLAAHPVDYHMMPNESSGRHPASVRM